jgi:methylglutaconyl-CoA hydratase
VLVSPARKDYLSADRSNAMQNPIADPLVEDVISSDVAAAPVRLDVTSEGIAYVTLTNAARKNAMDSILILAMTEVFETLKQSEHVRIVFLRGEGGTFSAGADLEWMRAAADRTEDDNREDALTMAVMLKRLTEIPALTVALVEGAAMGGGVGLVAACDLAIAIASTRFSFSEVRLGLIPATISPHVIRAIGPRHAKALFATGRIFGADHAREIGLVSEVVPDAAALAAAQERLAGEIMVCAPGAVGEAKALVDDLAGREIDHHLMVETAKRLARRRVSDEGREGVAAFLERRKPNWA